MDSPSVCQHPVLWRWGGIAHIYPASYCGIGKPMPGHDGLFAHQFAIGFSSFLPPEVHGFCRHRFDLFAIVRLALKSWVLSPVISR
jgi:hypothetical protein